MNQHALRVLQFPETLAAVAGYASSPLGAAAVRAAAPATSITWIETELRRVEEMTALLLRSDNWGMPLVPDVQAALRKLAVAGSVLASAELNDMGVLLRSSKEVRLFAQRERERCPLIHELAQPLNALEKLEAQIVRTIDESGVVRDNASRELARVRKELRGARSRIVQQLEQYMTTLPARYQVPDASVSVREGRYVIPVRREARAEIGGLVHDESATGNTLFIEPPVAIELMNRLRELELAEAREVQRILRELTDAARVHVEELRVDLETLVAVDALYARARYASSHRGHRPELLPHSSAGYDVVHGYHPLLLAQAGEAVVPFDLRLDPGERTLLVSGPNTGGKTVLLKAVGLISALTQAGIIPPVGAGTRLPIFSDVFADIGDEQSIEASLSTFSAHLKNLREVLEQADADSLVLIDEMGSGTDPAEGGALAQAILVELTRRETMTVATTHLGQLKLLAGEEAGIVNASLQFDATELRPTYRLQKGVPGRSYGLAIARRLGFPGRVLNAAEERLPGTEREVGRLIAELEVKEGALATALADTERALTEVAELKQALQEREKVVRTRERDAERRARQQARDLLLQARAEVEATISDLRNTAAQNAPAAEVNEAARQARRRIEETARKQAERIPQEQVSGDSDEAIEVGATVRISATGAIGKVVELRDGRALVESGGLRLQVPVAGLTRTSEQSKSVPVRVSMWSESDFTASSEISLIGLRAEEALSQLEPALDAAIRADLPSLRIIHGKGTGALRQVVAETLKLDPRVKSFRLGAPAEGGTGVTVAELK